MEVPSLSQAYISLYAMMRTSEACHLLTAGALVPIGALPRIQKALQGLRHDALCGRGCQKTGRTDIEQCEGKWVRQILAQDAQRGLHYALCLLLLALAPLHTVSPTQPGEQPLQALCTYRISSYEADCLILVRGRLSSK